MKLVDARSGETVELPKTLGVHMFQPKDQPVFHYGGGESTTIHAVKLGLLSGSARATTRTIGPDGRISTWTGWGPLSIRHTHPGFWLQRVAFVPS